MPAKFPVNELEDTDLIPVVRGPKADLGISRDDLASALSAGGQGISETVVDAKGDLLVATDADIVGRLGVGIDGQVLKANSAQPEGVAWENESGGGATNLSNTPTATQVTVESDTGTDTIIAAAGANAGVMTAADKTKLDGIETSATADQTDAEIKTAYENNADTNAFTDADETKLDGIAVGASATISGLTDTSVASPGEGDHLAYDGTNWVNRNDGFINVIDEGADPTGVADSSTAFNDAHVAAAAQDKIVYIPSGTYLLNTTVEILAHMQGNLGTRDGGVEGAGFGGSILVPGMTDGSPCLRGEKLLYWGLKDFSVDSLDTHPTAQDCVGIQLGPSFYTTIDYDNEAGGPFQVGESISWAGGAGTLRYLIDNGATGTLVYELTSGSHVTNDQQITGGTSTATCDADGTVASSYANPTDLACTRGTMQNVFVRGCKVGIDNLGWQNTYVNVVVRHCATAYLFGQQNASDLDIQCEGCGVGFEMRNCWSTHFSRFIQQNSPAQQDGPCLMDATYAFTSGVMYNESSGSGDQDWLHIGASEECRGIVINGWYSTGLLSANDHIVIDLAEGVQIRGRINGDANEVPVTTTTNSKNIDLSGLYYDDGNQNIVPNVEFYGADKTGTNDSSTFFLNAARALDNTQGGEVYVPAGTYIAEGIPLDTGTPGFAPITWRGAGSESTIINLPSSPTSAMFETSTTGDLRGGGVYDMTLNGDAQSGTGTSTVPGDLKDGTQNGIDLSTVDSLYEFKVDGCFLTRFQYAWRGPQNSRSPVFGSNEWRYNEICVYNEVNHPLFEGYNDFRDNYIALGGAGYFDCDFRNMKLVTNHYGCLVAEAGGSGLVERSTFDGVWLFKNAKLGLALDGSECQVLNSPAIVPADDLTISNLTYATTIITVTTSSNHELEVGDRIYFYDVTGLTPDPNELVGASELTVASVTSNTVFTVDLGSTVSGTWGSDGSCTPYVCSLELLNDKAEIRNNLFRESGDAGRSGVADIYINRANSQNCCIQQNSASGSSADPDLIRIFLASNCSTGVRAANVTNNSINDYAQAWRRIDGRIDQSIISGNNFRIGHSKRGTSEDVWELDDSTFGNIITNNIYYASFADTTDSGRYIFNVDAVRSVFVGNQIRYDESQWTAGVNITAVDGDTVPTAMVAGTTTGSTDTATLKSDNVVTSF